LFFSELEDPANLVNPVPVMTEIEITIIRTKIFSFLIEGCFWRFKKLFPAIKL
jgi:hypothetical protein